MYIHLCLQVCAALLGVLGDVCPWLDLPPGVFAMCVYIYIYTHVHAHSFTHSLTHSFIQYLLHNMKLN